MTERAAAGVHVHVQQHSSAVDAALQGHVPELAVTTPHTSWAAKGASGVLGLVVALGLVALAAQYLGRAPDAVAVQRVPAALPPPAMSPAEVQVLAGEVADRTAGRVEALMDARLGAVRAEVRALRAQVDRVEARVEATGATLRRGR